MKRWFACLLIAIFAVFTLPVLQPSVDSCAWTDQDMPMAEEEVHASKGQVSSAEENPVKHFAGPATYVSTRLYFDQCVNAALHNALLAHDAPELEVPTPPPNCA